MLSNISKHHKSPNIVYDFTVLIPTWNNLAFLQHCIGSIQKNSAKNIQIIVIANEGKDGTVDWLENIGNIDYVHAKQNIGICFALNSTRSLIKSNYVVYVNDDMYLLPDWDKHLWDEIQLIGHPNFMLSATMIEPHDTKNPCVVVRDFGQNLAEFQEERLLSEYKNLQIKDWKGSTWPPNVVHIDMWDLVGGLSIEFSPGMYSDPDFTKKLIAAGVTVLKGKGNSFVYHFGSKSTGRVKRNNGRKTFLLKWGVTSNSFLQRQLSLGTPFDATAIDTPPLKPLGAMEHWINRWKRIKSCF